MKDDIFNPNSYTEKAMPLTSAFCNMLVNYGNLGMNSDEMKTFISKRAEACKKLENTLNKEQQEMFFDMECDSIDQYATENVEYFCRGMKFGIMLMKELLG